LNTANRGKLGDQKCHPFEGQEMEFSNPVFLGFEWDENKNVTNIAKHQIDFKDAAAALTEPHIDDRSDRNGEIRTLAICRTTMKFIAVAYTTRNGLCRIISARAARKDEKRKYRQILGRPDP
jgi:uncharacterized DUF497 family protein